MQVVKALVLFGMLVVVHGASEEEKRKIFDECADANGFKRDPEKIKQMKEALKNGEKIEPPPDGFSQEFLCTQRCFFEKVDYITDGKFNVDKIKDDKMMMHHIEANKVEPFLKCLQGIEISECADLKKLFECRKA